jgi:hypothetical protein
MCKVSFCLALSGLLQLEPIIVMGATAQPVTETWTPTSRTAQAVTGKVTLTPDMLTLESGKNLSISHTGQMLFRTETRKKVLAELYRVTSEENPAEGSNRLCPGKTARYILIWKSEKVGKEIDPRTMAVFSGPKLDPGSTDDCGRYVYDRAR